MQKEHKLRLSFYTQRLIHSNANWYFEKHRLEHVKLFWLQTLPKAQLPCRMLNIVIFSSNYIGFTLIEHTDKTETKLQK